MPPKSKDPDYEFPLFILYGSATGNAEHIAKELASSCSDLVSKASKNADVPIPFDGVVCCEADQFKKKCAPLWDKDVPAADSGDGLRRRGDRYGLLVVTSTTGNGDCPENAGRFVRYLKRKQSAASQPLRRVTYAVLGLGDTNYDQFCQNAVVVDKKLEEMGATRFLPLAKADEATGLEDVVEPWKDRIFKDVVKACCGTGGSAGGSAATASTGTSSISSSNGETAAEKKEDDNMKKEILNGNPPKATSTPPPASASAASAAASSDSNSSSSLGLQVIRSLLGVDGTSPVPAVEDPKLLPSLLPSAVSSCTLLDAAVDGDAVDAIGNRRGRSNSVSTASSGAPHYTAARPYASEIQRARYLTSRTGLAAAGRAADVLAKVAAGDDGNLSGSSEGRKALLEAMKLHEELFPLDDAESEEINGKRVLELTLALPDDYTLEYAPGDSLGVVVENPPDAVEFVLNMLRDGGVEASQLILIDDKVEVTVERAVRTKMDLSSRPVSRRLLNALSQYAADEQEARALQLLSSKSDKGAELYRLYVEQQSLSIVDVLSEFTSCQSITIQGLMAILPSTIPPRYYSVSSCPITSKHSLTVAFSVVDYLTPSLQVATGGGGTEERGRRRIGGVATRLLETLCSGLLAPGRKDGEGDNRRAAAKIPIFPKPTSEFRMPQSLTLPLVLIGPGTGVAPFMGFLAHRKRLLGASNDESREAAASVVEGTWRGGYELEENELPITHGDDAKGFKVGADYRTGGGGKHGGQQDAGTVDLFFGCRHKDHDWLYREEMEEMQRDGIITKLYTVFSRDGGQNGSSSKYVQHLMLNDPECGKRLVDLITSKKAHVYLCGDGNAMAKDVQNAIIELLSKDLGGGTDQAKSYFEDLKASGRFLMDIWS